MAIPKVRSSSIFLPVSVFGILYVRMAGVGAQDCRRLGNKSNKLLKVFFQRNRHLRLMNFVSLAVYVGAYAKRGWFLDGMSPYLEYTVQVMRHSLCVEV